MKICELATATDLVCRHERLLEGRRALERGDFAITVGGKQLVGDGCAHFRDVLLAQLECDLAENVCQLAELGVELDPRAPRDGLPQLTAEAPAVPAFTAR